MAVKTNRPLTVNSASPVNAFMFSVEQIVRNRINTAIPVQVTAVEAPTGSDQPAGYVTVKPLVCTRDADDNVLDPTELFHVPYMRYQGGVVAVVCDPVIGDIGLAVFAQQDASNVVEGTTAPVQPGSFRYFDMADGFYVGGFLNHAPTCYLEFTQDNTAILHATSGVTIDGDVQVNGRITATGVIIGDGHSLSTHTHTGVHGETSTPNG